MKLDKPELWIICEDNCTRWTFEDAIGAVRTGIDPARKLLGHRRDNDHGIGSVEERVRVTLVHVEMAIGYKLLPSCKMNLETMFSREGTNADSEKHDTVR